MNILLYAGPAPWRDLVIQFSAPLLERVATSLTLVTGGGDENYPLLQEACRQLPIPAHVPIMLRALHGDAHTAILTMANERAYDLVIFGRFHQALTRRLPGVHSRTLAQRLEPSVLRVHGLTRPIRQILFASGGNHQTVGNVRLVAAVAAAMDATVTVLHVLSQQSLLFERPADPQAGVAEFLAGDMPESIILRKTAEMLQSYPVQTEMKVRSGPILNEILDEIHCGHYELLVIGAHRVASVLDRILLEDITGDLLDLCPIPVLVIKNGWQNSG